MYEYFLAHLLIETTHILADHEHNLLLWTGKVFPVPIEGCNAMRLELLRIVTETDLVINSVSTKRVLTRLLQVHYHSNIELEHLRDNIMLVNQAGTGPLRPDQFTFYEVGVQSLDSNSAFAFGHDFLGAVLAQAERALEAMFATELVSSDYISSTTIRFQIILRSLPCE